MSDLLAYRRFRCGRVSTRVQRRADRLLTVARSAGFAMLMAGMGSAVLSGCGASADTPREVEGSLFENRPLPQMDESPDQE